MNPEEIQLNSSLSLISRQDPSSVAWVSIILRDVHLGDIRAQIGRETSLS
jgi:hypothetical protein